MRCDLKHVRTGLARVAFSLAMFTLVHVSATPAEDIRQLPTCRAAAYAKAFQVPVELVEAIIQVESAWNPYAISIKGAAGLMQLMPTTAMRFGVRDRFDIEENIRGGVAYLAWLIRLFRGDLRLVVAAYQVGESQILSRGLAYSSPKVFQYVSRVAELYRVLCEQTEHGIASNADLRAACWSEQ
jgi:soluble lytic murein transglycosylase-like protein